MTKCADKGHVFSAQLLPDAAVISHLALMQLCPVVPVQKMKQAKKVFCCGTRGHECSKPADSGWFSFC